jgi:hypothetical protein
MPKIAITRMIPESGIEAAEDKLSGHPLAG